MQVLVATGRNAFSVKERLKQLGFKWYRQEKLWVITVDHDFPALRDAVAATGLALQTVEIPDNFGAQLFGRSGGTAQAAAEALAATPVATPAPAPVVDSSPVSAPMVAPSSLDRARAAAARAAAAPVQAATTVTVGSTVAVQAPRTSPVAEQLAALKQKARVMRSLMVEMELSIEDLEEKLKG